MKKFAVKFYIVVLIILLVILHYSWKVAPNRSGDLGRLNLVPYGKEYTLNVNNMVNEEKDSLCVTQCHDIDSISLFPVVTIGDSFSNLGFCSYPHFLGRDYGYKVENVERYLFYEPLQDYVALLNNNAFKSGQTVIVETAEHSYIWRLSHLDINGTKYSELGATINAEWNKDVLSETARWIRLSLNFNNPVKKYKLNKDCFSHPDRPRELYVYKEELEFQSVTKNEINEALDNLDKLFRISEEKGINLYFLVCADKYDSYEPWIEGNHPKNNTLSYLPKNDHIIVMTPYIRELISKGVKDVYQINDGHASTVGASLTANVIYDTLSFEKVCN